MKNLLDKNFQVTVLVRKSSDTSKVPQGVEVRTVDFDDTAALTEALKGQDAFVDCTLTQDDTPKRLMDAAAAAGVYRYIPSDWSLDPHNEAASALPVFSKRVERDNYLFEKCKSSSLTWTVVANGPFLDWNLHTGFMGIDLYNKSATLMDGGDNRVVWTTLDSVGKAVVGVMQHPEETANRPVFVQSVVKSCKEMVKHAEAALGGGFKTENIDAEEANQKALGDLFSGKANMLTFGTMIRYANARPAMSSPWAKPDNVLLGVPEMSDGELDSLIKEISTRPAPQW